MAEGSLQLIGLLIILQHEGIAGATSRLERACHTWLFIQFKKNIGIVSLEATELTSLPGCALLHIEHILQECIVFSHLFANAFQRAIAKEVGYLLAGSGTIVIARSRQLRRKHRIHRVQVVMVLDLHIGHWEQTAGEILRCGDGTLHRVGIEAHRSLGRQMVLADEALADKPLAEELTHLCLEYTAPQRQFTLA